MNKDLSDITPSERLWLWRQHRGLTQEQACWYYKICLTYYKEMEYGTRPVKHGPHDDGHWRPTGQRWHLARRRASLTLRQAARQAGFSHVGYLALERAGDQRIAAFWEGQGFRRFP